MDNSVLQDAILNGLISTQYQGNTLLGPQLLTNNQSSTIWQTLRHELLSCKNEPQIKPQIKPITTSRGK